jgi:hypothetical protein
MTALRPFDALPDASVRRPRRRPTQASNLHSPEYRWLVAEITTKLIASGVIAGVAIVGLIRLIPYQLNQQAKFQEVKAEVEETERRVDNLRSSFTRHFDPQQSRNIMQEQSPRLDPNSRRIFWKP